MAQIFQFYMRFHTLFSPSCSNGITTHLSCIISLVGSIVKCSDSNSDSLILKIMKPVAEGEGSTGHCSPTHHTCLEVTDIIKFKKLKPLIENLNELLYMLIHHINNLHCYWVQQNPMHRYVCSFPRNDYISMMFFFCTGCTDHSGSIHSVNECVYVWRLLQGADHIPTEFMFI